MTLSPEELAAYFERLEIPAPPAPGALSPNLETLTALHRAHALAIPFENLAIHERRDSAPGAVPIPLDLPSLAGKLIHRKRGGYCFEQNTLFQAVLEALGFEVSAFEARVRMGARSVLPRTHMVLQVRFGTEAWLADVGFGGDGLLEPVPLDGRAVEHGFRSYRVIHESDGAQGAPRAVLQMRIAPSPEEWLDLYAVEPRPVQPVDIEVASWYTSTHPESIFVKVATAQRLTLDARYALRGRTLTVTRPGAGGNAESETRELTEEEAGRVLREVIGIDI
jgi:N-hydroxyarylamine O-acetyltransferase